MVWLILSVAVVLPLAVAATSPLLQWREPVYIAAGLAGVVALALLLVQPLLAGGHLPGLVGVSGRRAHRRLGVALVVSVALHVVGLWITSPSDVVDALLLASPTSFSIWGVLAMWSLFAAALLAFLRRRLRLSWRIWRIAHTALATVIVGASVAHAMLVEGTMGTISKAILCTLAIVATVAVVLDRRGRSALARTAP